MSNILRFSSRLISRNTKVSKDRGAHWRWSLPRKPWIRGTHQPRWIQQRHPQGMLRSPQTSLLLGRSSRTHQRSRLLGQTIRLHYCFVPGRRQGLRQTNQCHPDYSQWLQRQPGTGWRLHDLMEKSPTTKRKSTDVSLPSLQWIQPPPPLQYPLWPELHQSM